MADSVAAWVALHSVPGMGPVTFGRLVRRFGTVERVLDQSNDEALAAELRLHPSLREGILRARARFEWAERTVAALAERGVRVARRGDEAYPQPLTELKDAPPLLYLFGDWRPEDLRAVGMVGSTHPSARGRDIARGLAMRLAGQGVTVVSGFAQGIDDASHLAALAEGGRSVLCLPFGIRRFRPRAGWPPTSALAERGAILSEQSPDSDWETQAALSRNRLIAALSRALIVVEAAPKGGTMNTFEHALGLGRPTFAVRFQEAPESARGNAIALGRGAAPLERLGDLDRVIEAVGRLGGTGESGV